MGGVKTCNISFVNPSERFVGRRILVSGGNSGIGLQVAKDFIAEGAEVIICARNEMKLQEAATDINSSCLHVCTLDVTNIKSIPETINNLVVKYGDIDTFVNCAGVYPEEDRYTEEVYDYTMDINTKGMFFMCRYETEYLKSKNIRGKIVNISSVAAKRYLTDPYTLSKWGVNCITQGYAKEMAKYGIIINGVMPGNVPSNIHSQARARDVNENMYDNHNIIERMIHPREVSSVVLYLASDSANAIIGQMIGIDGGWYD